MASAVLRGQRWWREEGCEEETVSSCSGVRGADWQEEGVKDWMIPVAPLLPHEHSHEHSLDLQLQEVCGSQEIVWTSLVPRSIPQ